MNRSEVFLSVPEIARQYRVSNALLYKAIATGRLKAVKLGRSCIRVSESALRAFMEDDAGSTKPTKEHSDHETA